MYGHHLTSKVVSIVASVRIKTSTNLNSLNSRMVLKPHTLLKKEQDNKRHAQCQYKDNKKPTIKVGP